MCSRQVRTHRKDDRPRPLLVVDDDALITATVSSTLRHAGFDVFEATDASRALELCAMHRVDLAILDSQLPSMGGAELAQVLREQYEVHSIFLSAYDDADLVQRAVAAGAISYLLKPLDPIDLLPTVRAALSRAAELQSMRAREAKLKESLTAAREINTAVGVLMERLGLQQVFAFDCLRAYARARRRRVVDVARELLQPMNEANQVIAQVAAYVQSTTRCAAPFMSDAVDEQ